MMKLFRVVSLSPQNVERTVQIDGAPVNVPVPAVIAQLVPVVDDGSGTIKVNVSKDHLELFKVDAVIEVSFAVGAEVKDDQK